MVKTFWGASGLQPLHRYPRHGRLQPVVIPDLPGAFAITESLESRGIRLQIFGELDLAVTGRLQDHIDSVARAGETVTLDLSELTFVDSSGLNVLVMAFRQARRDGWELRVERRMTRPVERVITMMGLGAVFWE